MTGSRTLQKIEEEAREHGFRKVRLPESNGGHRVVWEIECSLCGIKQQHGWEVTTSAALMVRNLRKANWIVAKGRAPVCADCRSGAMKRDYMNDASSTALVAGVIAPDPRLMVEIIHKLDDVFDRERRLYASGWSDEKVGAEVGVSPEVVTRLRRGAYGELAEDPVITDLRVDIAALSGRVEEVLGLAAKFEGEISALNQRLGKLQHHKAAG